MTFRVELFGVPRQRSGVDATTVMASEPSISLGDLLLELTRRFPELRLECIRDGKLQPACIANLRGERFLTDPAELVRCGDSLLLMSADVGG